MNQNRPGLLLKLKRKKLGIKMSTLASTIGISPSYLSCLENDRRPWVGGLLKDYDTALQRLMRATNAFNAALAVNGSSSNDAEKPKPKRKVKHANRKIVVRVG